MKDRYWMIKWATDQLLDPPEPEEEREEEEPKVDPKDEQEWREGR